MPFDYDRFRELAAKARTTRTADDAATLIGFYADAGCAMYPADVELYREVGGDALGFELVPYTAGMGGFNVRRAAGAL